MKFKNIIKTIGVGLLSSNPVGASILGAVNMFLPEDKKLPEGATGEQVKKAVDKLPPEQRGSLMEKEIDLEIEQEKGWTSRYVAMAKADGQSTRPAIALKMANAFLFVLFSFVIIIGYSVYMEGMASLNQPYIWTIFATLTATPAGLLAKYFGELRKEQGNRLMNQNNERTNQNPIGKLIGLLGGGNGSDNPPPKPK